MAEGGGGRRRWVEWAIGAGLVLTGFGLGWTGLYMAIRPIAGRPAAAVPRVRQALVERAEVIGQPELEAVGTGGDLVLHWQVRNVGESTWSVDLYRFTPENGDDPVLSLPATVLPGQTATVRAQVTAPPQPGPWRPVWRLVGRSGSVPGGRIAVAVEVESP